MNEPVSPPPPPSQPPPPAGGPGASQQIQGPAIGLIVTAVLNALGAIYTLLSNMLGMGGGMTWGGDYAWVGWLTGATGIVLALVALVVAAFILWAALQMKTLRNWTVSVVASILAMIPCISPCCIIGLPIGIWALVVLMKPEVKTAFTS
ncbi:MAG: hypothetical protein ACOC92_01575 [bacterium]